MGERVVIPGFPSVTRVLHAHGFYDLYSNPNIDSEAAMLRGRLVDEACNHLAAYGKVDNDWLGRHPECEPYISAYRSFLNDHRVKLIDYQFEVKHDIERYIGHPDQLCELDGYPFVLLSIKTGAIPLWNALQEAAYVLAMKRMPRFADMRIQRAALQLKPDGKYTYRFWADPFDFDHWTLLVRAWHVRAKYA